MKNNVDQMQGQIVTDVRFTVNMCRQELTEVRACGDCDARKLIVNDCGGR
jgi:hypothetical protein